jgi:hypothetical protein
MSYEDERVFCLRCNSPLTLDDDLYILAKSKPRGTPQHDDTVVNPKAGRLVRLFWCSNPDCYYAELRIPGGLPPISPGQR